MKIQRLVIFVKKNSKINMKDKKNHKVRDHCHYTEEYRSTAHSLCNLKYSVPKKVFHNG